MIPRTWYLIAGLVLALAASVCAALWQGSEATRYHDLAATANAQLEATTARLEATQRAVRVAAENAATAKLQLEKALEANPRWGAEPVPAAVAAGLCERARCTGVRPVSAPTDSN